MMKKNELESLYLKAKLTNTIMGHYPNMVGPDMILVGKKFEKMGNLDKALQYYLSVELDFSRLVDDIAYEVDSEEPDIREEDIIITKSLIDALDGIKRIGQSIDQEKLHNAKLLLVEIEKMVHQTTT